MSDNMDKNKLDRPLDSIIADHRRHNPSRRAHQGVPRGPAGGIQKKPKDTRVAAQKPGRAQSWRASGARSDRESKVLVSSLPLDVSEPMIKEYFNKVVGGVKNVEVHYGPDRASRGEATVTFDTEAGAASAFRELDKLPIDEIPIKIEVLVGGAKASSILQPTAKSLLERAGQPKKDKPQPRSAADTRHHKIGKGAHGRNQPSGRRGGRPVRAAKKSVNELDAEMADYFVAEPGSGENMEVSTTGAATNNNGGDADMNEIL